MVFPILSRNRFSPILQAIARATGHGKVMLQLSWPTDEVGNRILADELVIELGKNYDDIITEADLAGKSLLHPITGVDYIQLYREIINLEGAQAEILLANDPPPLPAVAATASLPPISTPAPKPRPPLRRRWTKPAPAAF